MHVVLLLIIADGLLTVYLPSRDLKWYQHSIRGSNEPFCRKIFDYICSNRDPQVLILGSSLVAVPSLSCDHALVQSKEPYRCLPNMFDFSHYQRCDFFKALLSQKLGTRLDVVNLGIAGAVASDQLWILEKAIEYNKKPALVICTVAPAEFYWNDEFRIENTRIKQAFKSYMWPIGSSDIALMLNKCRQELVWHCDLLKEELGSFRGEVCKSLDEKIHPQSADFTKEANSARSEAETSGAVEFNPDEKHLAASVTEAPMDARGRKNRLEDLAGFRHTLNHLDQALFDEHIANFNKLLELCDKHKIPVAIVNMPLTPSNREILPKREYQKYYGALSAMASAHHASFIDLDRPNVFVLSDFFDSAHLNEIGGRKFFSTLADRVCEQKQLCAARTSTN